MPVQLETHSSHRFQCACGRITGRLAQSSRALRGICYCKDCQNYARMTGQGAITLDAQGGTEVVATESRFVSLDQGKELLACHSLSETGLLRWYASCCQTPIANTLRNHRIAYVGLVHECLGSAADRERVFGPVQLHLNVHGATSTVRTSSLSKWIAISRYVPALLWSRISGAYQQSVFFDAAGEPISAPQVLVSVKWPT